MRPLRILDHVITPDGRELVLYGRDDGFFVIRLDGWELMSSRAHGSEEALAHLALEALGGRRAPRVLVGGLGMGFTLRATLKYAAADAAVTVAEVFPAVVAWNRGPLGKLARHPLDDPRVKVEEDDVAAVLGANPGAFDIVLLDVDNGPEAFTLDSNRRLYDPRGLAVIHQALAPGGVLAVWSADREPWFDRHLRRAGFAVESRRVAARGCGKGPRHTIFLARRSDPRRSAA